LQILPNLNQLVQQVILPFATLPDEVVWSHYVSREMSLKDAFFNKYHYSPKIHRAKIIWSKDIVSSQHLVDLVANQIDKSFEESL